MADNTIEIGFNVGNDDLQAGLDKAQQAFNATCAAIQQDCAGISAGANQAAAGLIDFKQALLSQDPSPTLRKAEQAQFDDEIAHVQELRSLNQLSADEAISLQTQIEQAKYEKLRQEVIDQYNADQDKLDDQKKYQAQLDQLELQHDAKLRQLNEKEIAETMQAWQQMLAPIGNAFSSSLSGMITGQESFRQALANIGNAIVSDFVNMAVKRATNWIASEATMTSASQAGDIARAASADSAAAAGKVAQAAAGSATVFGDANKAASGAYSAVAGIPIVGPILAPAAAVAAFAAVMAYDVFSAEGGFDIPAGLNPVTQLHEREMVLPASIAEPLRAGLGNGNRAGGDIHIHAVDAASFQRLLSDNKSALARALRGAHRTFDPALA
jgi:hypothetical protein